jgi:uncharacterized membrane protein YcfT
MAWWRLSLMDLQGSTGTRVAWADIAKAISILLLVFWTIVGDRIYVNETLILVRMPLFFFVSGLFASRVITRTGTRDFLTDKIGNLLYLYALWIALLFLSTDLVAHLGYGRPIDPWRQLALFWDPLFTIWFLYALAVAFLIARLVRRVPVWIVFAGAFALYLASVASGEWRHLPFLERIVRLFPFFWIGLVALPLADRFVERFHRLWPVATAAFLGLAWMVFDSPLNSWGVLTFAITMVGIAAMLLLARALSGVAWSWPLAVVGASTLYIYVTHKIGLFYLDHVLRQLGLQSDHVAFEALKVVPIVIAATLFGRWAQRTPWAAWLFAAPWTLARRTPPARGAATSGPAASSAPGVAEGHPSRG